MLFMMIGEKLTTIGDKGENSVAGSIFADGELRIISIDQYPVNGWGWAPLARVCNYWPTGRWIEGGIFKEGRFTSDPFEWEGKFELPESRYFTPAPGADPNALGDWTEVGFVTGDYQLTKQ